MQFNTRFNRTAKPVITCTEEERRTKSEFTDDSDINKIMARYKKTGVFPEAFKAGVAQYGDFSEIPTFMEMQNKVIAAQELFLALPAKVRRTFNNDPGEFIAAAETKEGRELLVSLGLGETINQGEAKPLKNEGIEPGLKKKPSKFSNEPKEEKEDE